MLYNLLSCLIIQMTHHLSNVTLHFNWFIVHLNLKFEDGRRSLKLSLLNVSMYFTLSVILHEAAVGNEANIS